MRRTACAALCAAALLAAGLAHADPVETLRGFVRDVKTGRAQFTQTVTSPDGVKKKTSTGSFEFSRPNRFRFVYAKPFEQTIVGDGEKVWIYDADLNQVSSRKLGTALGATPAALLAGGSLDKDFDLSNLAPKDGAFQSVSVGFKGKDLAALEIHDSFGQKSLLRFDGFSANVPIAAEAFRFTPPAGADVIEQ
ncbi:MAG: outer membrane lipoprotein chaperone LolA [Pseudomonadota bacterium]|nr:outer membrane lipoprotein chaperone LolA [Pseudomonadota bacterium]